MQHNKKPPMRGFPATLQEKAAELMADKYARLVYLQLLAPDKARYLQTELLEIVNPSMPASKASGDAAKTTGLKVRFQALLWVRLSLHKSIYKDLSFLFDDPGYSPYT